MEILNNHSISDQIDDPQPVAGVAINRRVLLKAGWILPIIAVTPLMNTASAMSSTDCEELLRKREMHKANGDKDAFRDIQAKLEALGCPC